MTCVERTTFYARHFLILFQYTKIKFCNIFLYFCWKYRAKVLLFRQYVNFD